MPDIEQTIQRVRGEIEFAAKGNGGTLYSEHLIEDVVAIISDRERLKAENEQMLSDIQGLLKKQSETRVENFRLLRDCLAGQMHSGRQYPCGCDDCAAIPTALKHIDKFIADIE